MKTITTAEGLTVHYHNKRYAVVKTSGLFTGNMYQIYEKIGEYTWERRPKNGIDLFYTIKGAKEHIKRLQTQSAAD
jgi:hypothetical protein